MKLTFSIEAGSLIMQFVTNSNGGTYDLRDAKNYRHGNSKLRLSAIVIHIANIATIDRK